MKYNFLHAVFLVLLFSFADVFIDILLSNSSLRNTTRVSNCLRIQILSSGSKMFAKVISR